MQNCVQTTQNSNVNMEEYLKQKAQTEDQMDYNFIRRIIQEITQSCALPLPLPASAIPPLIYQAASYFWENYDLAVEERYYCVRNADFCKYMINNVVTLPARIISVFGVYKTTDSFNYGIMGDFSLERMILNNSALASGAGGSSGHCRDGSPSGLLAGWQHAQRHSLQGRSRADAATRERGCATGNRRGLPQDIQRRVQAH